jgi:CspA family cold shock protein
MHDGTIKYFNEIKGYGFISSDDERNIFVHHSAIEGRGYKTLQEGQRVRFDLRQSKYGLEAVNVRRI